MKGETLRRDICIFVDIDDTIVRSVGSKQIPVPTVIRHVEYLNEQGVILYCWSSGGAEYAKESATEFGIAHCFKGFLPKPNVLLDDQAVSDWRRFIQVHPSRCLNKTIDDYWQELKEA